MPRISPNLMSQEAGKVAVALKAQDELWGQESYEGFGSGSVKGDSLVVRETWVVEGGCCWRVVRDGGVAPTTP